MDVKEIAERAMKEIREKGWCKNSFRKETGEICLATAFHDACQSLGVSSVVYATTWYLQFVQTIGTLFPDRRAGLLLSFNDHPDTTEEDILLVLKHLAAS